MTSTRPMSNASCNSFATFIINTRKSKPRTASRTSCASTIMPDGPVKCINIPP